MTTPITKEQLRAHIKKQMKQREMHLASPATEQGFREYLEMEIAVNEIALAAMDAEPVADVVAWHKEGEERTCDIRWRRFDVAPGPLFAVAQPVANVPTFDEWLEIRGNKPLGWVKDAMRESYDACRAAMLQAGNSPVIPDGWVKCSERMPEEYDFEIWIFSPTKGVNHSFGYDGYDLSFSDEESYSTISDVTHWMPIARPAAPQQEVK